MIKALVYQILIKNGILQYFDITILKLIISFQTLFHFSKNNRFYKSFSSFDVTPKFKNVLYGDLTGDDSIFSENLPDECFIDVIYEMFSKFYPKLNLPKPSRVIRSKWTSNPYVKGSYSYIKVGSFPSDVLALASPIVFKILLFLN